jgi:peptidyl-prolyl cis-trans isomerase C
VIRTRPLVLAAGSAVLAILPACSDVNPAAVRVEGRSVSRSTFEEQLTGLAEAQDQVANGTTSAELARNLAQVHIQIFVKQNELDRVGKSVTGDDRAAAEAALSDQSTGFPDSIVALLVENNATNDAYQLAVSPSRDDVAAQYAEPAGTGVMCLRHILVATEQEAQEVLAELDGGADFAQLAEERSTDPSAAGNGGALTDASGSPCIPVSTYESSFDQDFVAAAETAVPGTPVGPVSTQFGYHVILARPFDEVADAVVGAAAAAVADEQFLTALSSADIEIDPRYGTWDASQFAIVPASGPAESGTPATTALSPSAG